MAHVRSSRLDPPAAAPAGPLPSAAPRRPPTRTPTTVVEGGAGDPGPIAAGDHAALVAAVVRLGDLLEDTRDMLAVLTEHVARGNAERPSATAEAPTSSATPPADAAPPAGTVPPAPGSPAAPAASTSPAAGRAPLRRPPSRGPRPEPPSVLADHLRAPGDEDA